MSEISMVIFICQLISLLALTIGAILDWKYRFIYDWTWGMILIPGIVILVFLMKDASWTSNYWLIHGIALIFATILVIVFWFFGLWGSGDSLSYLSVSIAFIIPATAWHSLNEHHWPGSFATILYFIPLLILTILIQALVNFTGRKAFWKDIALNFGWKNILGLIFFGKKVHLAEINLEGHLLSYLMTIKNKGDPEIIERIFWKVTIFKEEPFFHSFKGEKLSQEGMNQFLAEHEILHVWGQRGLPFVSVLWLGTIFYWIFGFPLNI
ncbi:MAG: hypothetical protein ACTSYA_12870 [Candidatus Kariarchaeaceae archaeon]